MASRQPPDFAGLLARLARGLQEGGIPFMLIGGQAVLLHGEARLTQDIDVTLGVGPERLPDLLAATGHMGLTPLPDDVEGFVRDTFVLPALDEETEIRVDLIFSNTSYEATAIGRALRVRIGGQDVPIASAEDLILHKLFAGRARDLEDVEGVLRRRAPTLDWPYLEKWAREFAAVPGRETLPRDLAKLRSQYRGTGE
jgi:predicted nucleotidyltransferase